MEGGTRVVLKKARKKDENQSQEKKYEAGDMMADLQAGSTLNKPVKAQQLLRSDKTKPSCMLVSRFVSVVHRACISQRRDKVCQGLGRAKPVWLYYHEVKKIVAQDPGAYSNMVALKNTSMIVSKENMPYEVFHQKIQIADTFYVILCIFSNQNYIGQQYINRWQS